MIVGLVIVLILVLFGAGALSRGRLSSPFDPDLPWGCETPEHPMTIEEAMAHLTVTHPCGCVEHWHRSPPSGFSCPSHIGVRYPAKMPRYVVYANRVLRDSRKAP